jgi:hypothetical protein
VTLQKTGSVPRAKYRARYSSSAACEAAPRSNSASTMAGGMGVRKNVHVENFAAHRENLEKMFKFTRGNLARMAIFGIAVPVLAYKAICGEMETPGHAVGRGPERFGLPRRYFGRSNVSSAPMPESAAAHEE